MRLYYTIHYSQVCISNSQLQSITGLGIQCTFNFALTCLADYLATRWASKMDVLKDYFRKPPPDIVGCLLNNLPAGSSAGGPLSNVLCIMSGLTRNLIIILSLLVLVEKLLPPATSVWRILKVDSTMKNIYAEDIIVHFSVVRVTGEGSIIEIYWFEINWFQWVQYSYHVRLLIHYSWTLPIS